MTAPRMTCKEALQARYKVVGHDHTRGCGECAVSLSFSEALSYWSRLNARGFEVRVTVYLNGALRLKGPVSKLAQ